MTILFLHGKESKPGGTKPTYLAQHGLTVFNPRLPDDDFAASVAIAQAEFDQHKPDVVVGSSRGGAVAMNINCGDIPLILLAPAWKKWGDAKRVKLGTVVLHSRCDDIIPFADTTELIRNSELPSSALIEVGDDHRLSTSEALEAMLAECLATAPSRKPMSLLEKAIIIAVNAHRGQIEKKGAAYVLHPLRLMCRMENDTDRIVAVLHDVIEDTRVTADDLRGDGFSEEILDALAHVTKREGESYEAFVARAAKNPSARRVKLADLEDNMDVRRLEAVTDKDSARLTKYLTAWRYLKALPPLAVNE